MSLKAFIISFLLIVLALFGGTFAGMNYQKNKDANQLKNEAQLSLAVGALSSKLIPTVPAYGQVTKISGSNITINSQGQSITVFMNVDAKMYSLVPIVAVATSKSATKKTPAPAPASQQITLGNIKVGDSVSVNVKVLPTGQIEGYSLFIFPAITTTAPK